MADWFDSSKQYCTQVGEIFSPQPRKKMPVLSDHLSQAAFQLEAAAEKANKPRFPPFPKFARTDSANNIRTNFNKIYQIKIHVKSAPTFYRNHQETFSDAHDIDRSAPMAK